ncbi:hypothetical protein CW358_14885 [Pseudomonas protegens]|nr:hypothetical protein CW358_14885 [Pseudomonas protegens]
MPAKGAWRLAVLLRASSLASQLLRVVWRLRWFLVGAGLPAKGAWRLAVLLWAPSLASQLLRVVWR